MASQFTQEMLQTYVCATIGDMFTNAIIRGFRGNAEPMEFIDALLNGFQTATTYVAYPIAVEALSAISPKYKKAVESMEEKDCSIPKKIGVVAIGGVTAACIATAVNFPIKVAQERRSAKGVNVDVTPKQIIKYMSDQIGANVGINATSAMLESSIPVPRTRLLQFGRNHAINTISNLCGTVVTIPVNIVFRQEHDTLFKAIGDFLSSQIFSDMVLFETVDHFLKIC
jgi:hypothetical protein